MRSFGSEQRIEDSRFGTGTSTRVPGDEDFAGSRRGIEDEDENEDEDDFKRGGEWINRTLMKQAMPDSHLAAARATSRTWLPLALFNMRIRAQRRRRSPPERLDHIS